MVDKIAPPHLVAALEGVRRRIADELRDRADAAGLSIRGSEGRLLHLIGPDGARPVDLADGAWISRQAMSKRLRDMAERGLVTIETDPTDRRAHLVRRTEAGERLRAFTVEQIAEVERALADAVGEARYRVFREVADELARGFGRSHGELQETIE